ncbi:MAG: RsmB/NOP family class I SAM-dependent RNA methyltransferase, partial [Candidatus Sumerlaeota bacterium]|nr:RsmB/NOP family class I SAM-dependent RNA methyltransferase [Candidatus Sumerlaeota bacterium]
AHLAALAGDQAQILATDASKTRLDEVPKILGRLGVRNAQFAIANQLLIAQYGNWADAVLVDVPCTGMGTIRRHPEIRWLREREDVIQASLKQLMILGLAQQMVRPGGRMIYSTCTLFYEENRRVIETFLDSYRHFSLVDARQTAPDFLQPYLMADGMLFTPIHPAFPLDGFFAAVLTRNG